MSVVNPITPIPTARAVVASDVLPARDLLPEASAIPPVGKVEDSVSIGNSLQEQKKAVEAAAELAQDYRMVPEGISAYEIIQKIQVADASLQANTLVRLKAPVEGR